MADAKRVLVAEDHPRTRHAWVELIASWGFKVEAAEDGQRAIELIASFEPHILLLDLKLPIKDGLGVLGEIRQRGLPITTIVISGEGDIPDAVQAIKLGAYDYLRKPVDPPRLRQTLNNLSEHLAVSEENQRLRLRLMGVGELGPIIGQSQAMRRVMALVEQAAPSSASVIIQGDSGTGKEIVARTIHESSPRRNGPYVAINCAALPESLLESELFGHERGAFTGADQRRAGCFELANGGTLLLDEIGEMKPELQAKLLRVIEERKLQTGRRLEPTSRSTCGCWRPPIAISATRSARDACARTCTTGSTYLRSRCRGCRSGSDDLPALVDHFVREFARANSSKRDRRGQRLSRGVEGAILARQRPRTAQRYRARRDRQHGPADHRRRSAGRARAAASPAQRAGAANSRDFRPTPAERSAPAVSEPPAVGLAGGPAAARGRAAAHFENARDDRRQPGADGRNSGHQPQDAVQQARPLSGEIRL